MSRTKYKSTGCARFFVVLLILIPLAYFGARMIRGGEGIPAIDQYIESIFDSEGRSDDVRSISTDDHEQKELDELTRENEDLKKRIQKLEEEVETLKARLSEKETE